MPEIKHIVSKILSLPVSENNFFLSWNLLREMIQCEESSLKHGIRAKLKVKARSSQSDAFELISTRVANFLFLFIST